MVGRASPMQGSKTRDGATLALGLLREHHHGLPKACQLARCGRTAENRAGLHRTGRLRKIQALITTAGSARLVGFPAAKASRLSKAVPK